MGKDSGPAAAPVDRRRRRSDWVQVPKPVGPVKIILHFHLPL
jgi:hypothetical protein